MADSLQMVIANRLADGLTVFRTADGAWVESIRQGAVVKTDDEARQLLEVAEADAARNEVLGPYLIAITDDEGRRQPLSWREAIRASGPTVETGRTA